MDVFDFVTGFATYIVPFVVVLSFVVFFHEFGHFIIGRWCGVKVDAFSMGFGPELFAFEDRYGTRWRIAAIPLGGYVRFHGDANAASAPVGADAPVMTEAERKVTFFSQPVWKRAAIIVAGPLANFLLAIVIYTALFSTYGRTILSPRVGSVVEGGAAQEAGFKPGDLVLSIDGVPIESFAKMQEIISGSAGKSVTVVVRRNAEDVTLTATPRLREVEGPLGKARLGMLGLHASNNPGDTRQEHYTVLHSARLATEETWSISAQTFRYLGGLLTGRESADQLSGPIGIAQVSGQMAKAITKVGLWPFFNLIALLSVSIGLLNLLPVPLLDGGHLVFLGIEALRGRALNDRMQEYAFRLGLAVVGALMIFSTYNDIARLVRRFTGA
jgi:regulator of sigma E protease